MKKTTLYAYTSLVFGWLVCLQCDDTLGLNVLTPYLSAFRAEKPGPAKQQAQLVQVAAGSVTKTFCSHTGRIVFYTAMANNYKTPVNPVIIYSYQGQVNDRPFCFNSY